MKNLLQRIVALMVATVVPATVLIVTTAQPAQASVITRTGEISQPARLFVQYAAKARIDAMNNPGTVMNYAKMRTVFAPVPNKWEVSWRRQMAAAARAQGARISKISSGESAALDDLIVSKYGSSCPKCRIFKNDSSQRDGTNCSGREGLVETPRNPKWVSTYYWNSCQTNDLKLFFFGCAWLVGGVAAASTLTGVPGLPVIIGIFAGMCSFQEKYIDTVQSNSRYNAIGQRSGKPYDVIGPNGNKRTFVATELFSQ